MENIANQVTQMLNKISFLPNTAWRIALVGVVFLLVIFLIALLFTLFSKIRSLTKKLALVNRTIISQERIDEENVGTFNKQLKDLPEEMQDGWARFMEQRIGYPSDYMLEKNVLDDTSYSPNKRIPEVFFRIFGFLVFALIVFFTVICCADNVANLGLKDFVDNFDIVGSVVIAIVFPILLYIIFDVILSSVFIKQRKRLKLMYKSFLDNLDKKVVIYAEEEEEFTSDNLDEITKNIEEIIANRLGNKDIVEVITTPKVNEVEYIDSALMETEEDKEEEIKEKEEPVEEVKKEEVKEVEIEEIKEEEKTEEVAPVENVEETEKQEEVAASFRPLTKEEQASQLAILYDIVDAAIADVNTSRTDLEQIAELIYNNLDKFEEPKDREVLEGCLYKLADLDTIIANRNEA